MSKSANNNFSAYIGKQDEAYRVRLGNKVFSAKLTLNFTPDFDSEFEGGAREFPFNWNSVLVQDNPQSDFRSITAEELAKDWFKPAFKRVVNYQRSKERDARNSQTSRYSKNQRIAYKNGR